MATIFSERKTVVAGTDAAGSYCWPLRGACNSSIYLELRRNSSSTVRKQWEVCRLVDERQLAYLLQFLPKPIARPHMEEIAICLSVVAIVVLSVSLYWSYKVFQLLPMRKVVQKYGESVWRISPDAPEGTSTDEYYSSLNEAKLIFGGDEEVTEFIRKITQHGIKADDHDKLIRLMAKAARFKTEHWFVQYFESVFVPG